MSANKLSVPRVRQILSAAAKSKILVVGFRLVDFAGHW